MPSAANNGNNDDNDNNGNNGFKCRNDEIIQSNKIGKSNEMDGKKIIDKNVTFKQSEVSQISENNSVDNDINESSVNDFICTPGDYIVISGPIQKNNMKKYENDLSDNALKLALNEQEIHSRIVFLKSKFFLFLTPKSFKCHDVSVCIHVFVFVCM